MYIPSPLNACFSEGMESLILTGDLLLTSRYTAPAASDGNGKEKQDQNMASEYLTFESWLYSRVIGKR